MTTAVSIVAGLLIGFLFGRVGYLYWKTQTAGSRGLGVFLFVLAVCLALATFNAVRAVFDLA